jgi:hypothetical protein
VGILPVLRPAAAAKLVDEADISWNSGAFQLPPATPDAQMGKAEKKISLWFPKLFFGQAKVIGATKSIILTFSW